MGAHVIAVVGATATGKSGLAIELARALDGEIVNADSMQLYQGMDIGTAKEPEAAWQGVPHHLLDIWPVTQAANVADYQNSPAPRSRRSRPAAGCPSSSAAPACTSARPWTTWIFPERTGLSAPAWKMSSPASAPRPCTPGWPPSTRPRPARSCRATDAGSSAPWR